MNKRSEILLTLKYCLLLSAFWGLICVIGGGYTTVFLLERNFSSSEIGIIVAVGSIAAVILQPVFASIADSSGKVSLQKMIAALGFVAALSFLGLYLVKSRWILICLLFVFTYAVVQVIMPLTNAVSMYYINRGVKVNFGLARGVGSAFYAVISNILGRLTEARGCDVIPVMGVILSAAIVILAFFFPVLKDSVSNAEASTEKAALSRNFFKKYPGFPGVLAGVFFLFIFHNLSNNYMIQIVERVGGGTAELGTGLSIAAVMELPVMFLFSFIRKRFKSSTLLTLASVMFFFKALAYVFADSVLMFYGVQLFQIVSYGLYIPTSVYYVNERMQGGDTVKGQALIVGAGTFAGVAASAIGGLIIDGMGVQAMLISQVICAAAGAVLIAVYSGRCGGEDRYQKSEK